MAGKTFLAADESKNFQKAVAGETELRGKSMTQYNSQVGIKKYRYLYNADTVSKAAGLACTYILSNTTYPTLVVDQPTTGSLNYFAGVFAESCTSGVWTWVQTWGYNSAAQCRRYGSDATSNGLVGDTLTVLNGVDALTTIDGSASSADLGPANPRALNGANAVRLVAVASHGTSTTTSNCVVFVRGYIP